MKKFVLHISAFFVLTFFSINYGLGQIKIGKIYTVSAIGYAFPVGQTNDYFKPKSSTTIGLNMDVGEKGFFLYPQIDFHAYSFFQQIPTNTVLSNNARATTFLINLAVGYRKNLTKKLAVYGYAGLGGGVVSTPHIIVQQTDSTPTVNTIKNKNIFMPILEGGVGVEYSFGSITPFFEASYMQGLSKIQGRPFNTAPVCLGIKTDVSKLLKKKKK